MEYTRKGWNITRINSGVGQKSKDYRANELKTLNAYPLLEICLSLSVNTPEITPVLQSVIAFFGGDRLLRLQPFSPLNNPLNPSDFAIEGEGFYIQSVQSPLRIAVSTLCWISDFDAIGKQVFLAKAAMLAMINSNTGEGGWKMAQGTGQTGLAID